MFNFNHGRRFSSSVLSKNGLSKKEVLIFIDEVLKIHQKLVFTVFIVSGSLMVEYEVVALMTRVQFPPWDLLIFFEFFLGTTTKLGGKNGKY